MQNLIDHILIYVEWNFIFLNPAHCVTLQEPLPQRAAVCQVLPNAFPLYNNSHAATPWGSSTKQIQHKVLTAYEWECFQHGRAT